MHELSHRAKQRPQLQPAVAASPSLLLSPSGAAMMERSNSQGSSQGARPRRQPPPPPSPQARVTRAVRAKRVVPSASGRRESSREPRHPRSAAQTARPRPNVPSVEYPKLHALSSFQRRVQQGWRRAIRFREAFPAAPNPKSSPNLQPNVRAYHLDVDGVVFIPPGYLRRRGCNLT